MSNFMNRLISTLRSFMRFSEVERDIGELRKGMEELRKGMEDQELRSAARQALLVNQQQHLEIMLIEFAKARQ